MYGLAAPAALASRAVKESRSSVSATSGTCACPAWFSLSCLRLPFISYTVPRAFLLGSEATISHRRGPAITILTRSPVLIPVVFTD